MKLEETCVSFLLQLKPLSFRIEPETKHSDDYLFIGPHLSHEKKMSVRTSGEMRLKPATHSSKPPVCPHPLSWGGDSSALLELESTIAIAKGLQSLAVQTGLDGACRTAGPNTEKGK